MTHEHVERRRAADEARAVITRIYERYPDPVDLPLRTYDVDDRAASRAAILHRLGRRSR